MWYKLTPAVRKLHARNVYQILGKPVSAGQVSSFVVCYTPRGSGSGGTGQALRIAKAYNIPIFDYGNGELFLPWYKTYKNQQ